MNPPGIALDAEALHDPVRASRYEWLETNGTGAYAMGTPVLLNTRKYHSLLTLKPDGCEERHNLLSHVDIELDIGDASYWISTNRYPSVFYPKGYELAERFELDLSPMVSFILGVYRVSVRIVVPTERDAVLLRFDLEADSGAAHSAGTLRIRPFLAYRQHHGLTFENDYADLSLNEYPGGYAVRPYAGMPELHFLSSPQAECERTPDWYRCFRYDREQERGYDFEEDLMTPGILSIPLSSTQPVMFCAATERPAPDALESIYSKEMKRRDRERRRLETHLTSHVSATHLRGARLLAEQSRHFLISPQREGAPSIIAGFPWFGEWGRDAMIALEGLTLDLGRDDEALGILETFARFEQNGLFPNQLSVSGRSSYNTVDASLWYFYAVHRYLEVTGDRDGVMHRLFPAAERIVSAYLEGRVPDADIDETGLLSAGNMQTQLTWMDASVGGVPVTPRYGFPVEIQALWYHALRVYQALAPDTGEVADGVAEVVAALEKHFLERFWLSEGYLADGVFPDGTVDRSIRPNQIIAVALPNTLMDPDRARKVLDTVEAHLLTPYGLRSLSPSDASYLGRYSGSQEERDRAYHQGTVWPWPVGVFCEAYVRYFGDTPERLERVSELLKPLLEEHPFVEGMGSVSEVLDGDPPHSPGGCPMQAWSVAGVLHAMLSLPGRGV